MAETNEKTKYFLQRRVSFPMALGRWEKVCDGHKDVLSTIACAENAKALYLGTAQKIEDPGHIMMDAAIRASYLQMAADGGTVELCVAKFTVTREVIEEMGIVSPEKVQPKKEVP